MKFEGKGKLVRIFIGESDRCGNRPLHEAIVRLARQEGLAGATVFRGIEGYGANSRLHTAKILRLSQDLPVMIEIADQEEKIQKLLPYLDDMVTEGLITLENIEIIKYTHSGESSTC